jgi:molybdopterin-guanine dinucleotide biosynthesis protein A
MSHKPIGVILAGGKGARMGGRDKGLLDVNGRKLIETSIAAANPHVSHIIISANRNLAEYQKFSNHVVPDCSGQYSGPLAGILSVMEYLDTWSTHAVKPVDLLILPCDMPLLPADLTVRLYNTRSGVTSLQAVAVHDGDRLQPLCCLLPLEYKSNLKAFLDTGNRKVMQWLQSINALEADFSDQKSKFVNINSHEDLTLLATALKTND